MNAEEINDFSRSLQIKMDYFNNKNNTEEKRLVILEELYRYLLTPRGREYTAKHDNFRNVLKVKVEEFMKLPMVNPNGSFMEISQEMLIVIRNMNMSN
jgi:hypothetical protein